MTAQSQDLPLSLWAGKASAYGPLGLFKEEWKQNIWGVVCCFKAKKKKRPTSFSAESLPQQSLGPWVLLEQVWGATGDTGDHFPTALLLLLSEDACCGRGGGSGSLQEEMKSVKCRSPRAFSVCVFKRGVPGVTPQAALPYPVMLPRPSQSLPPHCITLPVVSVIPPGYLLPTSVPPHPPHQSSNRQSPPCTFRAAPELDPAVYPHIPSRPELPAQAAGSLSPSSGLLHPSSPSPGPRT